MAEIFHLFLIIVRVIIDGTRCWYLRIFRGDGGDGSGRELRLDFVFNVGLELHHVSVNLVLLGFLALLVGAFLASVCDILEAITLGVITVRMNGAMRGACNLALVTWRSLGAWLKLSRTVSLLALVHPGLLLFLLTGGIIPTTLLVLGLLLLFLGLTSGVFLLRQEAVLSWRQKKAIISWRSSFSTDLPAPA